MVCGLYLFPVFLNFNFMKLMSYPILALKFGSPSDEASQGCARLILEGVREG